MLNPINYGMYGTVHEEAACEAIIYPAAVYAVGCFLVPGLSQAPGVLLLFLCVCLSSVYCVGHPADNV